MLSLSLKPELKFILKLPISSLGKITYGLGAKRVVVFSSIFSNTNLVSLSVHFLGSEYPKVLDENVNIFFKNGRNLMPVNVCFPA